MEVNSLFVSVSLLESSGGELFEVMAAEMVVARKNDRGGRKREFK